MTSVAIFLLVWCLVSVLTAYFVHARIRFVWCRKCKRKATVNHEQCFEVGWPKCCGYTMTIDPPEKWSADKGPGDIKQALDALPTEAGDKR